MFPGPSGKHVLGLIRQSLVGLDKMDMRARSCSGSPPTPGRPEEARTSGVDWPSPRQRVIEPPWSLFRIADRGGRH